MSKRDPAQTEYSFVVRLTGVTREQSDAFEMAHPGWCINGRDGSCAIFPFEEENATGDVDVFLAATLEKHAEVFRAASQIGPSPAISVAVYFDARKVVAICPTLRPSTMKAVAELGYDLELCMFPCRDEEE